MALVKSDVVDGLPKKSNPFAKISARDPGGPADTDIGFAKASRGLVLVVSLVVQKSLRFAALNVRFWTVQYPDRGNEARR
ncbi:MAG: hypothetical protein AAFO77_03605 [Pseudomonadota bacterium]